jgi:Rrf2 family protein
MLQISRGADYGVRIMIELAVQPDDRLLSAADLAARTGVPISFLHKITGSLVRAGLVSTYKGPSGGLRLARPAALVSLLDVLEAVDGPVCLNACMLRPHECPRDTFCPAEALALRAQPRHDDGVGIPYALTQYR